MGKLVIVSYDPVADPPAGSDNQAGDTHEGVEESLKFHTHHRQPQVRCSRPNQARIHISVTGFFQIQKWKRKIFIDGAFMQLCSALFG